MTSANPVSKRKKTTLQVEILNRQKRFRILRKPVASLCASVLRALAKDQCSLTVVFVGRRRMQALNSRYRDRDRATDVLSFSYGSDMHGGISYLGDVVIAPGVAFENARRWRTSGEAEIRRLLVHGVLHLLGYDHETDAGEMNRLQGSLLRRRFFVEAEPVLACGLASDPGRTGDPKK